MSYISHHHIVYIPNIKIAADYTPKPQASYSNILVLNSMNHIYSLYTAIIFIVVIINNDI